MGTSHVCHLRLPNSYAPDDGLVVETYASAPDKAQAADDVCLAAVAFLCANRDGLRNVLLRPAHWKKPIQEFIDDIGRIVDSAATYEPLAVHNRLGSGFTGELADVSEPDLERAAELVHRWARVFEKLVLSELPPRARMKARNQMARNKSNSLEKEHQRARSGSCHCGGADVSGNERIDDIGGIVDPAATYEPLAVHNRHGSGFTGLLADVSEPDLECAAELVHLCLRTHNGSFAPSSISHKQIAAEAGQSFAKVYTQLCELLPKNSLHAFIQQHPEFKCEYKGTMLRMFQNASASGAPGADQDLTTFLAENVYARATSGASHTNAEVKRRHFG